MSKIHFTTHARERFTTRWRQGGCIESIGPKAFAQGLTLPRPLQKTITLLGFVMEGYWTATYKVYEEMVFVFQRDNNGYVLVTIFPLRWLKKRRIEMILRAKRKLEPQKKFLRNLW